VTKPGRSFGGLVAVYGSGEVGGEARLERGQRDMGRARLQIVMGDKSSAEKAARAALADFAGAMNWLEDMPGFDVAHLRLDEAGRWVREAFGCWLKRDGTSYARTCPADLAHLRVGNSPGMTNIVRECSVCGQDPRSPTCRHIKGRAYPATRRLINDRCNLCDRPECEHADGDPGVAECWHLIVSADLVEVSLVPRPAQPMARIREIDVDLEILEGVLGPRGWEPGMDVSCDRCLRPCPGVREYDPTVSAAENLL
jgi:hypothetical protein